MRKHTQADPGLARLADLIADAEVAMLTTEDADGTLRSRPLMTLEMDEQGRLWFFTELSTLCGRVRLLRDPDKARDLWTQRVKPWFPAGLDDPDLGLLEVTVEEAEYWNVSDEPHAAALRPGGLRWRRQARSAGPAR